MKYLKLFEEYDIELIPHLKERGIDPDKTKVMIDEESGNSYFFLYNLSGQIIGYQKYNPNLQKKSNPTDPKMAKYFTWVSDEGLGKHLAVWGLESVDFIKDKYFFITDEFILRSHFSTRIVAISVALFVFVLVKWLVSIEFFSINFFIELLYDLFIFITDVTCLRF